jgi:hypothetical protein
MWITKESGGEQTELQVAVEATVGDLVRLGHLVGTDRATTLVNGKIATGQTQLREADVVTQLPIQGKQAN